MDGFFEDPVADSAAIIAPAVGALSIGSAEEFDEAVLWRTDGAFLNQLVNSPPQSGHAQFEADGEQFL